MYTTRERAWCKRYDGRQMCYIAAVCCCCCCCCAVAAVCMHLLLRLKSYVQQRVASNGNNYPIGGELFTKNDKTNVGFSMSPTRLGEAESNPLFLGASSWTFNAPNTATVLGGIQTCVVMYLPSPCIPAAERARKNPQPPECSRRNMHIIHIHIHNYQVDHEQPQSSSDRMCPRKPIQRLWCLTTTLY